MFNFSNPYNRTDFVNFLEANFLPDDFQPKEERINTTFTTKYASSVSRLGVCKSLDLDIFEINHTSTHDARVGISGEAFKLMQHNSLRNRALVAFVPKGEKQYRFSLLQIEAKQEDHSSRIQYEYSNPRRYSFILGEKAHTKTPEQYLYEKGRLKNSEDLQYRFSIEALTKQFYQELFAWYQWAISEEMKVTYPNDTSTASDDRIIEEHIIRLITRLMFVWFIKQKQLVPDDLFDKQKLTKIIKDFNPNDYESGNYYNGVLQNLFFATLNNEITQRAFATDKSFQGKAEDYGIKTLFRNPGNDSWFKIPNDDVLKLFSSVPFLNGGLFECLDKETPNSNGKIIYSDGFSRSAGKQKRAFIPNILFFDDDKGIISILNKYNFTVEENTSQDVEVALDPELLGKVFENLLGAYNPETKETARKQSGSFYTPREIVNYMVDESLISYLGDEPIIRELFHSKGLPNELQNNPVECNRISEKLKAIKILDPACGSGAYPMGILNRMVSILNKLDHDNQETIYEQKLHLIENCIYGIDIQTIAVQISKLRFFISLICEQEKDCTKENWGIPTLPNLETKFVAANSLIYIKKKEQLGLFENPEIQPTQEALLNIRHEHFNARTSFRKKECRRKDKELREKLFKLLADDNAFAPEDAKLFAEWNPYDQNSTSPFFDSKWMFGLESGFDIVIGNPPYIQLQNDNGKLAKLYDSMNYKTYARTGDIYCLFYERGWQLLKPNGRLCFITSNKWMRAGYGEATRKFFADNTNPEQLIDFAGIKIFESATVDTNILMFSKDKNRQQTKACVVKNKSIKDLSVYFRQNHANCNFKTDESWVVLSPIEQRIKAKIEAIGTPLKDWNINIYRGILTGYNNAFIIDGKKKDELITADPKSAEIIRPILRGRDIKRYGYEFADLWLINAHNGIKEKDIKPIDINDYPIVKKHLDQYYSELEKRQDKGATPYNLRNCAYTDDFSKQKIIWIELTDHPNFSLDSNGYYLNNTVFFITGDKLAYIICFLNSKICEWYFDKICATSGVGTRRWIKMYIDQIKLPQIKGEQEIIFNELIYSLHELRKNNQSFSKLETQINLEISKLFDFSKLEFEFIMDSIL